MNFNKNQVVNDGYVYNFYGNYTNKTKDLWYNMIDYAKMAKRFMNRPFNSPLDIVGNYEWHQAFPYEEHLRFKTFSEHSDKKVLDFGCGPGRMIERAKKYFGRVDGVDISDYAIEYARQKYPDSNFYVSSGIDVGDAPENYYDMVFSTICIQHIPVRSIRTNILRGLYNLLVPGGYINIQLAFNPTMQAGVWSPDTEHASYISDFWNAKATNGHADMVINNESLPLLVKDFDEIFNNVDYTLVNVSEKYNNLNGAYHAPYWATDWLFIEGEK